MRRLAKSVATTEKENKEGKQQLLIVSNRKQEYFFNQF